MTRSIGSGWRFSEQMPQRNPGVGDVLFLNLGDPEVMRKSLEIYPANRWSVGSIFAYTIQPKIILEIWRFLPR